MLPVSSLADFVVPYLLFLLGSCCTLSQLAFIEGRLLPALTSQLALAGGAFLLYRKKEREQRRQALLALLPVTLGVGLSVYLRSILPVAAGSAIALAVLVWLAVFRHPRLLRSAMRAFGAGDYERALELVNALIERRPECSRAYALRSAIHRELLDSVAAEADARSALRTAPSDWDALGLLGHALMDQGRYGEAKKAYDEALAAAPHYAFAHYNRGEVCYELGEFDEAARDLRFALRGRLPFPEHHLVATYHLAKSLEKVGQAEAAADEYRKLPRYAEGYERLLKRRDENPDRPSIRRLSTELEDIGRHLS